MYNSNELQVMAVYLISVRNAEGFYFIIFCSVVYSARFSLHFSYPQRGAVLFQITVSCPTASPEINGTQHFSSSSTSRKSKLDECTHWNTHRVCAPEQYTAEYGLLCGHLYQHICSKHNIKKLSLHIVSITVRGLLAKSDKYMPACSN